MKELSRAVLENQLELFRTPCPPDELTRDGAVLAGVVREGSEAKEAGVVSDRCSSKLQ